MVKILLRLIGVFAILFCLLNGCKKESASVPVFSDTTVNGQRILLFSGYNWLVGTSSDLVQGPGPNFFSDSKQNVWLDQNGLLHLKITHVNNKWYCARVSMLQSFSHGRYLFQLDSRIDNLDKNVVGGLFTYASDTQEIDVEFSKWGLDGSTNSQFTVQPASVSGNKRSFSYNLTDAQSTHWFNWQTNHIDFASFAGHSTTIPTAAKIMQQWSYTGANIPPDINETVHINLWLYRGVAPSDLQEAEMIVSSVQIL